MAENTKGKGVTNKVPALPEFAPCALCITETDYHYEGELGEEKLVEVSAEDIAYNTVKSKKVCLRCSKPYCVNHASPVDPENHCEECLPEGAVTSSEEVKPLIDDEGVRHTGRYMLPDVNGPVYRTLPRAVSSLTDLELVEFIESMSRQIREAEKSQDYRRIALSTAKLEQGEREDSRLRAMRGVRQGSSAGRKVIAAVTAAANNKKNGKAVDPKGIAAGLAGLTGLTPEKLKQFLAFAASKRTQASPAKPVASATTSSTSGNPKEAVKPPDSKSGQTNGAAISIRQNEGKSGVTAPDVLTERDKEIANLLGER